MLQAETPARGGALVGSPPGAPLRAGHQRSQRRRPSRTSRDSALTFNAGKAGPQGATRRDPGAGCRGGAQWGASGRVWAWLVATRGRQCFYWHRGAGDKEAGRWPTTRRTAPWEAKLAPQTSTALRLLGKRRKCVTGVQTQAPVEPTSDHGARPGHGIGGWQVRVTPVWLQGLEGGPFPIASPLLPPAGAGRGRGAEPPTAAGGRKEAGPTGPAAGAVGRSRRAGSRRLAATPRPGRGDAPRGHRAVKATQCGRGLPGANHVFSSSLRDPQAWAKPPR